MNLRGITYLMLLALLTPAFASIPDRQGSTAGSNDQATTEAAVPANNGASSGGDTIPPMLTAEPWRVFCGAVLPSSEVGPAPVQDTRIFHARLSWKHIQGASDASWYEIERRMAVPQESPWIPVKTVLRSPCVDFEQLLADTTVYRVRPVGRGGRQGAWSNTAIVFPPALPPADTVVQPSVDSTVASDSSKQGASSTSMKYRQSHDGSGQSRFAFKLNPCRPNPASDRTIVRYQLPAAGGIRLSVYNLQGQVIRVLYDGFQSPGWHDGAWDARDIQGRKVATGVYFLRLEFGNRRDCKTVMVVR